MSVVILCNFGELRIKWEFGKFLPVSAPPLPPKIHKIIILGSAFKLTFFRQKSLTLGIFLKEGFRPKDL